uniref:DNA-directed RNA polymerase n=1 Tax=Setaria italica TaxID=4555 RepID=K4AL54_SETIT
MGGYFICGGMERLIRILILQKRNYPMGLVRGSFVKRGAGYTDKAVVIRCVHSDQSSVTIKLYYLQNGSARLGFWLGGREFLLPVGIVLKMAKQTMGFCGQALKFRTDVKAFHLQTPQTPIVRTATYGKYCMDEFPSGTNAIVAVLAYTGLTFVCVV